MDQPKTFNYRTIFFSARNLENINERHGQLEMVKGDLFPFKKEEEEEKQRDI